MAKGITIAVEDLEWAGAGASVLSGVSFALEAGTITACVGSNGAGKTTLLNLLSGWARPTAGRILVDGQARKFLTPESAHRLGIARRFDPPKIIRQLTVFENIELVIGQADCERLIDAMFARARIDRARQEARSRATPIFKQLSLEGKLDQRADSLSVGEQKLLDFALGLLSAPLCMLLDEPLKDRVHDERREMLSSMLRSYAADGGTALFVEHDLPFLQNTADRVLVLDTSGKIAWDGSTSDQRTWEAVERIYHRNASVRQLSATYNHAEHVKLSSAIQPASKDGLPRLSASGLTAGYGGTTVLYGASIQLNPGEIAVLRGQNGAGKSTLLFALTGVSDASGTVLLDGKNLENCPAHERARLGLEMVSQDHKIFPSMTVIENLLAGNAEAGRSRLSLLRKAFAWFPELSSRAGLRAAFLSAGQQQMVALARAFLKSPRCLLLDEPTSGLDQDARKRVREIIRQAAKGGAAVLLVEHVRDFNDMPVHSEYLIHGGQIIHSPSSSKDIPIM
jgi:branched-chain amino acid transport system ATP-binding protein